jgi:hypothetical protein
LKYVIMEWVTGWPGVLVGWALAIVVTFVFYKRALRDAKPVYVMWSVQLVNNSTRLFPGLVLRYEGEDQSFEQFTVTRVAFWNKGCGVVRQGDVVPTNPLRMTVSGGRILRAVVIQTTNDHSNFARDVSADRTCVNLTFAFLGRARPHERVEHCLATGIPRLWPSDRGGFCKSSGAYLNSTTRLKSPSSRINNCRSLSLVRNGQLAVTVGPCSGMT